MFTFTLLCVHLLLFIECQLFAGFMLRNRDHLEKWEIYIFRDVLPWKEMLFIFLKGRKATCTHLNYDFSKISPLWFP